MKTAKLLSLLLAALMLAGCFTGCGKTESQPEAPQMPAETPALDDEPTNAPAPPEVPDDTDADEAGSGYSLPLTEQTETLTYFFYLNAQNLASIPDPDNLNFFRLAEEQTNVHIDYTLFGSDDQEYSIMVASGEYCDLIDNVYNYPGGYNQALADGFVVELSEIIPEYMPNYNALRQSNAEYYKDTMLDNGDIAVVWGLVSDARGAYPVEYGPLVRKDWMDELGLEMPETYDDWHEILTAFKTSYGAYMWAPASGVTLHGLFAAGYGINGYTSSRGGDAPYYIKDGKVVFGATTDEYKSFLQMFRQWYDEGIIDPDFINNANPYAPDMGSVASGRWGIFYCIKDLIDVYPTLADEGFALAPIADPVLAEGSTNTIAYPTSLIQKQNTGISADSDKIELAARWLDFWYCDEGIMIANYGEEGVNYDIGSDGEPHYTEYMTNNPNGIPLNTMLYVDARNMGSYMNLWFKTLETSSPALVEAMEVWSVHEARDNYPAAVTMTAEEVTEHTELITDILIYIEEYTIGLMTGSASFDNWDAYVAEIERMGIDRCLEIKQAAYERYLAR